MVNILHIGTALCAVFAVLAGLSLVLPHVDEMYQPLYGTDPRIIGYSPPSFHHILGTDFMGRDLFSQLCAGARFTFISGVFRSAFSLPFLLLAAFLLSRMRKETPRLEDTLFLQYIRFIAVPLGVIALMFSFVFMFFPLMISFWGWILLNIAGFCYLGWLAVGRDMEASFRAGRIRRHLLLSYVAMVISYSTLLEGALGFFGFGDPSTITWGMMIQWCFTSGYTFEALHWLLPPIGCIYLFSRGMLCVSYELSKQRLIFSA